jgi:hypothetical protein
LKWIAMMAYDEPLFVSAGSDADSFLSFLRRDSASHEPDIQVLTPNHGNIQRCRIK